MFEWPSSTVAASVSWSNGWNAVLSEIGEAEKSGQIVIALNYSLVDWRNASSNWVLEKNFGCMKWLLPRTSGLWKPTGKDSGFDLVSAVTQDLLEEVLMGEPLCTSQS